jgi:regulator of sirC expression with transglutaminase-like and TPR domain
MRAPTHCLPSAYEHFSQALEDVESDDGIARIATAIAMHHQPGATEEEIVLELDRIASTISDRVHDDNPRALLAHLHQHLFDELGFRGNKQDYYDPRNSFLPWVIRSRRGIPITLSLVYKLVAGRLGLPVVGLNAPGHFLVQVQMAEETMIVDPFHDGTVLSGSEARSLVCQYSGRDDIPEENLLRPATHRQWIARILANLLHIFSVQGDVDHIGAMSELYDLLKGVHP